MNLYTYCQNDPVQYYDPSGNYFTLPDFSGAWNRIKGSLKAAGDYFSNKAKGMIENIPLVCYIEAATGKTLTSGEPITRNEALVKALDSVTSGLIMMGVGNEGKLDITLYRGGESLIARPGIDVKVNKLTGLIGTNKGVSLNINPDLLEKFGGAFKVENLPAGLKIIQKGKEGHYEIVPTKPMTLKEYQNLLNKINLVPKK